MTFLCLFPLDIDGKNEAYFMFLAIKRHFFQYRYSAIEISYHPVGRIYLSRRIYPWSHEATCFRGGVRYMAERRKNPKKVTENRKRQKKPAEKRKRELWRKPEKPIFKSRKAGKLKNNCGNRKTLFQSCGNRKTLFKSRGKPEKPK